MKPRVVVSACLGFEACRYDGRVLTNPFLRALAPHADLVRVCPEVQVGLPTPRDSIQVELAANRRVLVQPATGRDLTRAMDTFAASWLSGLSDVDGFVLKSRSPSCAVSDAKRTRRGGGAGSARAGKGPGLFAEAVLARFPRAAVEDESRLEKRRRREHFLTRIFTTASFRRARERGTPRALAAFHAENTLLFTASNKTRMRALGRILADADRRPLEEVYARYEDEVHPLLARLPHRASHVRTALYALGRFEDRLPAREKARFLRAVEAYREGRSPLAAVTALLTRFIDRFEVGDLAGQTWFEPFPPELLGVTGSGTPRG